MIRLLLVDDQSLILRGLKALSAFWREDPRFQRRDESPDKVVGGYRNLVE